MEFKKRRLSIIRAYIADYRKLELDKKQDMLFSSIGSDAKEKAQRYRFEADRIRSAVGAVMIRSGVRRAFPNAEIHIEINSYGKPCVSERTGYEFNLSHSGSIIAFVEGDEPVGIDVELVKDKKWRLFQRYLSDEEMKMIETSDDPEACFFEVWTIREAFAKEEGLGLRILDKSFSVDYDTRKIYYDGRILCYRSFDHYADERYKISICSSGDLSDVIIKELTLTEWNELIMQI